MAWTLTVIGEDQDIDTVDIPDLHGAVYTVEQFQKILAKRVVAECLLAGLTPTYVNLADEGTFDEDLYGTAPAGS